MGWVSGGPPDGMVYRKGGPDPEGPQRSLWEGHWELLLAQKRAEGGPKVALEVCCGAN